MQRKVIDSNYLRNEKLANYLARSPSNLVVLTDYVGMEAYKGDPLVAVPLSMQILSRYPKQVIVLKNSFAISRLRGRAAGLTRRMIDREQTANYAEYCRRVKAATGALPAFALVMQQRGQKAAEHMEELRSTFSNLTTLFRDAAQAFTKDELFIIRQRKPFTEAMLVKFRHHVFDVFGASESLKFARLQGLKRAELPNLFAFRMTVTSSMLFLQWIANGSQPVIKGKKLRNDMVDATQAAYATYFDGMLSNDKKLQAVYRDSCRFIEYMHRAIVYGEKHVASRSHRRASTILVRGQPT